MSLKKEIRVIGVDDGPFDKHKKGNSLVVGTVFRGGQFMDGLLSSKVRIDGNNATTNIATMIKQCKFYSTIQCVFLDGITYAGFNVVDVKRLHEQIKIPLIVIMRKQPDIVLIKKTLKKLGKGNKTKLIDSAGKIHKAGKVFFQTVGIDVDEARLFIRLTTTHSFIPEPLRAAHLIASGITLGESKGKA